MQRSKRLKAIGFLAVLAFFISVCVVAAAQQAQETQQAQGESGKVEVMTGLEQRMQKRISVDFRETPIEDVIRIMAEQADVDVVKSPKVTGTVTAKLTNVPLEEALKNILAAQGYDYVASKNMIRVSPVGELTQEAEKLVSKIYRITYADIDQVEKSLTKFISQRGSISSNPGTSNVIVTDSESKIKAIDTFVEEIDRITPQILVEARIYDIKSQDKLDLGVEWNAGQNTTFDTSTPPGSLGVNPTGRINPFSSGVFTGATSKSAGTTGALRFGWLKNSVDIDFLLKAQKNLINAKLLANPRILVLDNESAHIKIISEVPYIELTQTSGGGSIGSTEFREIGVTLAVTPHVTRDRMVRLKLRPEFSVETGTVNVIATGGSSSYPQPIVDKREANTTLLVESGKTIVLGGLRKKETTKQINKIPLLGDIPLICYLFRFEGESTVNSELVVFVTPWIVDEPVLTEKEMKQYQVTDFDGPNAGLTRAEKKPDTEMEQ